MYEYAAKVIRVIDGDTIEVEISLGFYMWTRQKVRLVGVNTPEKIGKTREAGLAATEFTKQWLAERPEVVLQSAKPHPDDKYGRFLARVYDSNKEKCLNSDLLAYGHAVVVNY